MVTLNNEMLYLITICNRDCMEKAINCFKEEEIPVVFANLCSGTASSRLLNVLGLQSKPKVMMACVVSKENENIALRRLNRDLNLSSDNTGIAFSINVASFAGASVLKYVSSTKKEEKGIVQMNKNEYTMVVSIVDKGHTSNVINIAKEVGYSSGTIVHGKAIETKTNMKAFGISVSDEKEIVYFVIKKEDQEQFLNKIMEKCSFHSNDHAISFTIPIESVVGLKELF